MTTGAQVRNAIKSIGKTMDDAAKSLGISRQSLYFQTNKTFVGDDFLQLLKDKLGIDLTTDKFINGVDELLGRIYNTRVASEICRLLEPSNQMMGPDRPQLSEIIRIIEEYQDDLREYITREDIIIVEDTIIENLRAKFLKMLRLAEDILDKSENYQAIKSIREKMKSLSKKNPADESLSKEKDALQTTQIQFQNEMVNSVIRLSQMISAEIKPEELTFHHLFNLFSFDERLNILRIMRGPKAESKEEPGEPRQTNKQQLTDHEGRLIAIEAQLQALKIAYAQLRELVTNQPFDEALRDLETSVDRIGISLFKDGDTPPPRKIIKRE